MSKLVLSVLSLWRWGGSNLSELTEQGVVNLREESWASLIPERGCVVVWFRQPCWAWEAASHLSSCPFLSETELSRLDSTFQSRKLPRYCFLSNEDGEVLKMATDGKWGPSLLCSFSIILIQLLIAAISLFYLFLAALGLCCWAWPFSSCGE